MELIGLLTNNRGVYIVSRAWAASLITILLILSGCGLNATRNIVPVPDPDLTFLMRAKGLAVVKDGIAIVVVPLPDVKELDGFGIIIVNETTHWVSLNKADCILIQGGEATKPMTRSQSAARLGSGYKAKMPDALKVDISDWRRSVNFMGKRNRNMDVTAEDDKISIIGGTREDLYFYYRTQGNTAPMQLIFPNIYNEATGQRTRFSFKFNIEKT